MLSLITALASWLGASRIDPGSTASRPGSLTAYVVGSVNRNVAPLPSVLSTPIRPP